MIIFGGVLQLALRGSGEWGASMTVRASMKGSVIHCMGTVLVTLAGLDHIVKKNVKKDTMEW